MKRKYVESRLTKDKETKANGFKGFSSVQQSTNFTSSGLEESNEDDQKEIVKEKSDVPVVVRGALTNWPSLDWGEEGWLKALGDQEIEVAGTVPKNTKKKKKKKRNTTYWSKSDFCR